MNDFKPVRVGDRVVFRLGERENYICGECGSETFGSKTEKTWIDRSGDIFIVWTFGYGAVCPACKAPDLVPSFVRVVGIKRTDNDGNALGNATAVFATELTPVGAAPKVGQVRGER